MGRATLADHGPRGTPAALPPMISAQRDAANLLGCGFFDMYAAMGGADSNVRWSSMEPHLAGPDGIHFTAAGYERLANALYEALVDGYEQYAEANPEG
jgi:lysophospholipase L1-like esterase